MDTLTLGDHPAEFYRKGQSYCQQDEKYFEMLRSEFQHEDLNPRLSALALKGLQVATGCTLDDWDARIASWRDTLADVLENQDEDAYRELITKQDGWISLFEHLRGYLRTAALESRRLSTDAQTESDARTIFEQQERTLIADTIAWFEELAPRPVKNGRTRSPLRKPTVASTMDNRDAGPIVVRRVTKRYGSLVAVDRVSLTVRQGEVFGLLGPNSAGKTTLIECIEGIRDVDAGQITVLGRESGVADKDIRARIGVQLQVTGFYDLLTLRETLDLYASFYRRPVRVQELIDKLELQDKAKTLVKDLSGGMYQRLSLAVALINDPDLVFLDEPSTGLDPKARRGVWETVRELQDKGKTIFLTTHYMEEAEALCDRVAIMDGGTIKALGTPAELVREHVGERTIEVDFEADIRPDIVQALAGVDRFWIHGKKVTMTTTDPRATMSALLDLPVMTTDIKMRQGNLEDVFLKIADRGLTS
jgi:ABC-2 type transport system ATP-binding protein